MAFSTSPRGAIDERFRVLADSLPLLVWISGSDTQCTYVNQPWLDFTGRPLEAELGDGWANGIHSADRHRRLVTYFRAFNRRAPFTLEYRLRHRDGDFRWVLDNAAPLFTPDGFFAGYIGACVDVTDVRRDPERMPGGVAVNVTERRNAEAALRRKERDLNETQRLAGVGSWQWDPETDTVVWSEELYRIAGRDPSLPAVSYHDHAQLYTPESWERLKDAVETALDTGAPYTLDLEMIRAEGTRQWVTARGEAQRDSTGRLVGLRGTVQDITERKRAEEALSSVNRRLIEAQESERARIARDLHDDIGQRLTLVALTLKRVTALQPDSASEALNCLKSLQIQTAEITADVQALSHELHSSRLQLLGVAAAMRSFCKELAAQKHVAIEFQHQNVPASVAPDASLSLIRVLQEALHNAVRHSQVGRFTVHLRGTGDALQLTIRDNGVGFDVEASQGVGLGLTSMKERLKLVGGELLIESRPRHGTTVVARVPGAPGR